jgi:hypothetical protein
MTALTFTVSQLFNRRSIGYLWSKKDDLDPGQVSIINSIYNNKKKGSIGVAEQSITYKLSNKGAGKLGYGRLYGSKGSFETLEKECRGTICKEYYHDIDVVNCHPVILVQFAKTKYNVELPEVEKYVENRETYLKNVMTENSITRDEAKQAIISILYGSSCSPQSFLYELSQEVRGFSKKLFLTEEYADLAKVCKGQDNIYGTFLSFVLQTEERRCMIAMKECLQGEGWSVDVLCYDGVMIRKREGKVCDLQHCEKAIQDCTNYKVSLITKEFSFFDMPLTSEEIVKGVTKDAYLEMKEEFEKNHFYHSDADKYVEIRENGSVLFMDLTHAHEYLNTKWCFKVSDKFGDTVPFLDLWRKDNNRKICSAMSFAERGPDVFTVPIRWAFQTAQPSGSTRPLELFRELIDLNTSGDPIIGAYMTKYFAHMLQKPCELPCVALVLTGDKRIGKDTLGDFLQKYVVGDALSTNYTKNAQFFGTHDMGKINKFLIKLEETSKKDCFDNASELKSTITARQITANPKGVKEVTADNFARYMFTTNKTNPMDLSDGEGRFLLSKCSKRRKNDFTFWNEVRKILFTYEAGRDVADYLMSIDISDFQVQILPKNDYQESIIKSEETSEQKFIQQWNGERLGASELYEAYKTYCLDNSLPYADNAAWFGRNMQTHVRDGSVINVISMGYSYYKK